MKKTLPLLAIVLLAGACAEAGEAPAEPELTVEETTVEEATVEAGTLEMPPPFEKLPSPDPPPTELDPVPPAGDYGLRKVKSRPEMVVEPTPPPSEFEENPAAEHARESKEANEGMGEGANMCGIMPDATWHGEPC